jgi:hypothetical protein
LTNEDTPRNAQIDESPSFQRQEYQYLQRARPSRLSQERIGKLNELKFIWDASQNRGKELANPPRRNGHEGYGYDGDPVAASESLTHIGRRKQSTVIAAAGSSDHESTQAKRLKRSNVPTSTISGDSEAKPSDPPSKTNTLETNGKRRQEDPPRSFSRATGENSLVSVRSEAMLGSTGSVTWNEYSHPCTTYHSRGVSRLSPSSLPGPTVTSTTLTVPSGALRLFSTSFVPQTQQRIHCERPANHHFPGFLREGPFPFAGLLNPHTRHDMVASLSPPALMCSRLASVLTVNATSMPSQLYHPSLLTLPAGFGAIDAQHGTISSMIPHIGTSNQHLIQASTLASNDLRFLRNLAVVPALLPPAQPPASPSGQRMT